MFGSSAGRVSEIGGLTILVSRHHSAEAVEAEEAEVPDSILDEIFSQKKKKAKVDGQATLSPPLSSGVSEEISVWVPLHLSAVWKDSDMTQHVLVAISLPSGVAQNELNNIDVHVESDGLELVVGVNWPTFMCNVKTLHRVWMPKDKTPPLVDVWSMMTAFSDKMATMRASENAIVMSVARFPLEIKVAKKVNFIKLLAGRNTESRVLYIDLKAEESTYKSMTAANVEYASEGESN